MGEAERIEMVATLEQHRAQLVKRLSELPMVADTMGLRRRKAELESKLQQVEAAHAAAVSELETEAEEVPFQRRRLRLA